MAQDSDVARVTAALKAPGLRYRSFSNEPVRTPRVDVGSVAETFPLFGSSMEEAAEMASPELPDREPVRAALAIPPAPLPEPEPIAAPPVVVVAEPAPPPPPPPPVPVYVAPPPPPPPAPEPPAFVAALSQPAPAPVYVPQPSYAAPSFTPASHAPAAPPAAPAAPAYSLLESLGRQSDLAPSMAASAANPHAAYGQPAAPSGTFASLLSSSGAGAQGAWGAAVTGTPLRGGALLPAAAVTVPLSEVLRLIAAGAPSPASPFDAFRAAVRPAGSR